MKKENGITLIALIITIIVMLILVGVTINALNGGLFDKAKTAAIQTELEQIKEQLVLKKAEIIADSNGNIPSDYGISLSDLELPESIKTKYADKLTISQDGTLYYTDNATATDIVYFENAGITAYQEPASDPDPDPEPEPNPDPSASTYPLSRKTFKNALYSSMDTFNIVFSDTTFTWYGETGTYEYNSSTNKITGSITLQGTSYTINTDLYTSGDNSYFEFSVMGVTMPMVLNPTLESIIPFNGTYTNGSTSYVFSKDANNYGTVECSGVIVNTNYCYFEETDTLYYGDSRTLTCTHNQDYSSITIDDTTYSK